MGRVWCGSQFAGVSVFNGKEWADYNRLSGPLGERIYAIKCCALTGDVWVATNCGLSRYSEKLQAWKHYTRLDGLPPGGIGSMAFDLDGTLYAGTLSDGVVIATLADDYKTFQNIRGPDAESMVPNGAGLPTNLIECLLVSHDDVIYAGTQLGLARSADRGQTWSYDRGENYAAKVKALIDGPPADFKPAAAKLNEDWVSSLAEDAAGMIWIGHRQLSYEVLDPTSGKIIHQPAPNKRGEAIEDVRAILPLNGLPPLIGYRDGLALATVCYVAAKPPAPPANAPLPSLPVASSAPNLEQLHVGLRKLLEVPYAADNQPAAIALESDCATRGAWLGRYGKYWCVLCNMRYPTNPWNYTWGAGEEAQDLPFRSGTAFRGKYSMYYYDHKGFTPNERTLELPPALLDVAIKDGKTTLDVDRREAEWNDGGWKPLSMELNGPNVTVAVKVPEGNFILSAYNHNKDGQKAKNRYRDFLTCVRKQDAFEFDAAKPVLAHSRIKDFFGGEYQRFLVRGPGIFDVEIQRSHSHCAQVAGVMLDSLDDEAPFPYFGTLNYWNDLLKSRTAQRAQFAAAALKPMPEFVARKTEADAADAVFERLEELRLANPMWWASERRRFYTPLARWYTHALTQEPRNEASQHRLSRLGSCYYHMGLFKQWEDCRKLCGILTPRQIEKSVRAANGDENGDGQKGVLRVFALADQKPVDPLALEDAFAVLKDANPIARIRALDRICTADDPRSTDAGLAALKDSELSVAADAKQLLELRKLLAPLDERTKINTALDAARHQWFDGRLKKILFPKPGPADDQF